MCVRLITPQYSSVVLRRDAVRLTVVSGRVLRVALRTSSGATEVGRYRVRDRSSSDAGTYRVKEHNRWHRSAITAL